MDKTDIYIEKINTVMDYIDANLDQFICLEKLAYVACLSKFHFHRVFHAFTNESLYSFITRLRVERAGAMLLEQHNTITNIALACGFNDVATFSRAFKKHFGVTASMWIKNRKIRQDCTSGLAYIKQTHKTDLAPQLIKREKILDWSIAYYRHTGEYAKDSDLFGTLYQQLLNQLASLEIMDVDKTQSIVIYHDSIEITDDDKLRLSFGVPIPNDLATHGKIGRLTIQGNYIICRYVLSNNEYGLAWQQVYREVLPQQGLQPSEGYCFECYPANCYDAESNKTSVEICVPVKPL